jgi:hypothetical protein
MNMKLATNKNLSSRIFNRAPINFWKLEKKVEEDSTIKTSYKDSICHEVKYNTANKESASYKLYIKPFSHGIAEQWLKFKDKLNIVIHGNGLNNDGLAHFNVTQSLLKVRLFISSMTRQQNKKKRQKILMFNVPKLCHYRTCVPADNPLLKQKTYMNNTMFLHLSDRMISEFHAQWIELNNYLDEFPPFGPNQNFTEDEAKNILYNIIPKG